MVCTGNSLGSHLCEGIGGRVEEFRRKLCGSVREGVSENLAARDENGAIWEDDAVGEGPLVCHVADCDYARSGGGCADGDNVGV